MPNCWVSEWVLGLCQSEPRFLLHLIDQSPDYVHFVCLVRLALLKYSADDESLKYATWMLTQNKKSILQSLYPSHPDGLLGMLAKLPDKPLSQDDYHRLVRLLADENLRKMLCHKKRVRLFDLRLFEMLEDIPQEFQCGGVMECVKTHENYESLQLLIRAARHLNLALNKSEISAATRQLGCLLNLSAWFMEKFKSAPFPPPPWTGNDWIKPVCCQSELEAVGEKFKNCIRSGGHDGEYFAKVALGYGYFDVCNRMPAVIEMNKDAILGWGIVQMNEAANRELSVVQKREIIRAFCDAGKADF